MKKRPYRTLILVVSIIGLGAYALWQYQSREATTGTTTPDSSAAVRSLISTAQPVRRNFTLRIPWVGTVESQSSVELTALVAGRVETIVAADQGPVEKGRPVMQLGGPQIEDARIKLTTDIESLGAQLDLVRETLARLAESLKAKLATRDQVAAAQEAKLRLEGQLRDARVSLSSLNRQSILTAPIKGIFTNRRVSVGQDVAAGQVVGDIIDTERLRIEASCFPPQDLELPGKEATVRLNENQTVTGMVRQVLPRTASTGAVQVWIAGPQIDAHLHPGQTVGGDIAAESRSGTLAIPESAIVYDDQEQPFVFVGKDNDYVRRGIQTGLEQDGWVEVISGLQPDQLVVVRGAYELFSRKFNEQFKVQD